MKKIIILSLMLIFLSSNVFAFTMPKLNILQNNKSNNKTNNIHNKNFNMLYHIHGNISLMPILRVDFVKIPLWKILQKLSTKTGYMFNSKGINLGEEVSIEGKYNFAELLNKLFRYDTIRIMPEDKKINIEGR